MNYVFVFIFIITSFYSVQLKNIRDPFFLVDENISNFKIRSEDTISLVGIVKLEDRLGVILKRRGEQEIAFLKSNIWGYKVKKILEKQVVLEKGEREVILSI